MKQDDEFTPFKKLQMLCKENGFLDAYIKLVMRHVFVKVDSKDSASYEKNLGKFKKKENLNVPELLLLLHLLCENTLDTSISHDFAKAEKQADMAEQILDEIHEEYWQQMRQSLKDAIINYHQNNELGQAVFGSVDLEEMSLYPEEVAYPFQYPDFAKMKYKQDDKWMHDNLGFTAEEMVIVVSCIVGRIPLFLSSRVKSGEKLLAAFDISKSLEYLLAENLLDKEIVDRVVAFFTCDQLPLDPMHQFSDFNCLSARPIVKIEGKKYLFLPQVLCRASYESPYYAMLKDSSYASKAASHRGDFTETFVYQRFVSLLGKENVYRNVNLWNGKNLSSEIDVMGVVADRAIIVQCKSKRMTQKAQQGDESAARKDFKEAVNDAYVQNIRCARDLCNGKISVKDGNKRDLSISREYKFIYPICVVSDQYPSLAIQSKEYLESVAIPESISNKMAEQVITDIFFIDVLAEMLQMPILLIDYLDKRCSYGRKLLSQSEINVLGFYLSDGFAELDENQGDFNYYVDGDWSVEVDAAMTARRLHLINQQETPSGILSRIKNAKGGFEALVKRFSKPRTEEELAFGRELLLFQNELIERINEMIAIMEKDSIRSGRSHSVTIKLKYGEGYGLSLVLRGKSDTKRKGLAILNQIANNDRARGGNWFVILLNAQDLSVEHLTQIRS